jgi:hypothetical protein
MKTLTKITAFAVISFLFLAWASFALAAPTLNSISPNPVTGSSSPQTFTLSGSGFVSGAKVQVAYASNGYTFVNTSTNATYVSSTQLTVPITTSTTADTWKVRVQNPDATLSGQINLVVNSPTANPPTLNSISPNPVTGSTSAQTFTLSGSNFVSGAKVQVAYASNGYTFTNTNTNATFVSSTQLTVPITTSTTADTWKLRVQNPGGQLSGQINLVVNSPSANPPALNSISPNPVTGSTSAQMFTLSGSNFVSGAKVQVAYASNGYTFTNTNTNATFVSSTQLTVPITTSTTADTWKVRVVNPDGQASGQINLVVNSPTANPPTLNSISPNPVTGSTSAQTFTLSGSNFVSGAKVQVAYASNGYTFTNTNTNATFVSSTQLTVPITTSTTADTWKVRVVNPDGQASGQINLVVNSPTPNPPALNSISPNPVTGSTSPQTFTLSGSNFVNGAKVQVAYASNGYTFTNTNTNATFVSSTQLTVPITTSTTADTWKVRVANPDGQLSGQINLVVNAPGSTAAPSINNISPAYVTGSINYQLFTINGSNFVNGATIQVGFHDNNYTWQGTSSLPTFFDSSRLTVQLRTGLTVDTWNVRVQNPDGQISNTAQFAVTAQPQPDLVPSNVTVAPSSFTLGIPATVSFTVTNQGNASAVASVTRLRINPSATSTSANDISLGDVNTPAITPGQSVTLSQSVTLTGITSGTYYVWVSLDNTKVTNQSSGANDYGHSPAVSVSTATSVQPPTIQSISGSQTIADGQTVTLAVVASVAPGLTHQWKRNDQPIQSAFFQNVAASSITTGLGGTYTVDISNPGGLATSPQSILTVTAGSTPAYILPSVGNLSSYNGTPFNASLPTIVITHGWQREGPYNPSGVKWQRDMAGDIRQRLGNTVNILLFAWPEAYTPFPERSFLGCDSEGNQLQLALQSPNWLGTTYTKEIQFIGHSHGTFVNAQAINKLTMPVDQVTILDAPISDRVRLAGAGHAQNFFWDRLSRVTVGYVDNYIADVPTDVFGAPWVIGGPIKGAAPNSGQHWNADHAGLVPPVPAITDAYRATIQDSSALYGFNCSRLLYPAQQQISAWNPPTPTSSAFDDITNAVSSVIGQVSQDVENVGGTLQNVFRFLTNGTFTPTMADSSANTASAGDGAIQYEIRIPADADELRFKFLFSQLGNGDYLTVAFNNTVLYDFLGQSFIGTSYDEAVIPVSGVAGQSGLLQIILHAASSGGSELRIANLHFDSLPAASAGQPMLGNISTRLPVGTGDNAMIGGFIITGSQSKDVVVRGIGPSLTGFGVAGPLADPTLQLRDSGGAILIENDNWQDNSVQAAQLTSLNLALQNPKESGIFATLKPGAYTAILGGNDQADGVALVEIYDTNGTADSQLANISTRGFVQTADNVMIGGFILGGSNNTTVAVRGIGPSLAAFGLSPVLTDPTLELHDSNGATLLVNDDWQDDPTQAAQLVANGLAPANPKESGIFTSLPPGQFTAILGGKDGGTGIGVVEVYNLH